MHGDTGGVVVWGRDLSVVGVNGAEARGISCGVPETGDKVECKKAEGRFVAECDGGKSASGSGDATATDLLRQKAGDSGGMGGLTDHIRCMREVGGLQVRGEDPGALVETGGSVEKS